MQRSVARRRRGLVVLVALALAGLLACNSTVPPTPIGPPPLAALGPVPVPPDNPITEVKVELGRLLYFDHRLSGDTAISCATCHQPTIGWGDGRDISTGYPGTRHWRNSQTIVNSAYYRKLFWAGESPSLETQAHSATTGNTGGNGDPVMIEERLAQIPEYVRLFKEAFGVDRPVFSLAMKAIATFERVEPISADSPFDRSMRGDRRAMSAEAIRGMELFEGKAGCLQCHNGALLSDESFHNLGTPKNPFFETNILGQVTLRFQHYARGVPEELYRRADRDLGLYYTSKRTQDKGKFRTPMLRYLAYTAPYMHNGVFATLAEVVEFYDLGGGDDPYKSDMLRPLGLTDQEKRELLKFLASLSGDELIVNPPQLPQYAVVELAGH